MKITNIKESEIGQPVAGRKRIRKQVILNKPLGSSEKSSEKETVNLTQTLYKSEHDKTTEDNPKNTGIKK